MQYKFYNQVRRKEMELMSNKHTEFAESLRNIIRKEEKKRSRSMSKSNEENIDEDIRSLQEMLEAKFDELFGPVDSDD